MSTQALPIGLLPEYAPLPVDPLAVESNLQGSNVAGQEFLAALARSAAGPFERFAAYRDLNAAEADVRRVNDRRGATLGQWQVSPLDRLPGRLRTGRLALLHTTEGPRLDLLVTLRARCASRPVPLCAVTYGLVGPRNHAGFFSLLMSESLPCDAIVCISQAARCALLRLLESMAERLNPSLNRPSRFMGELPVIPFGVDLERFRPRDPEPARERLGLAPGAVLILSLGRMNPIAKMDLIPLLLAMDRVRRHSTHPIGLVIAGADQGGYGERVLSAAQAMGLGRQVVLLRDVPAAAVPDLYNACDLFVSVSDTAAESLGLTLIEAAASGLPTVASDWDGYRDVVVDGVTGLLVPTRCAECDAGYSPWSPIHEWYEDLLYQAQSTQVDVPALADRLSRLAGDERLRRTMGESARRRAEETYGWPRIIAAYESLWTGMARAAPDVRYGRQPSPFSQMPSLFDLFQQMPSEVVPEDMRLYANAARSPSAPGALSQSLLVPMRRCLSDEDLASIVQWLHDRGSATWSEAIDFCLADLGLAGEDAARHVLWLLKQGWLSRGESPA